MIRLDNEDKQILGRLLTPSWLSGLIAIGAATIICLGTIIVFNFNNSAVQQQLTSWQQNQPTKPLTKPGEIVTADGKPHLKDSWPLLIVWGGIGLGVYVLMAALVHSLSEAEVLRESLGYVNARPLATLEIAAGHLFLRFTAFIALVLLAIIFYKEAFPYAITAAHAAAVDILSLTGILYAFLSFAMITLGLHLITIFLRLSLGRARAFA